MFILMSNVLQLTRVFLSLSEPDFQLYVVLLPTTGYVLSIGLVITENMRRHSIGFSRKSVFRKKVFIAKVV